MATWICLAIPFFIGWLVSTRNPRLAWNAARWCSIPPTVLLVLLALGGFLEADRGNVEIHRWLGHGMVIVLWICAPIAITVLLEQRRTVGTKSLVTQLMVLTFVIVAGLLASFTGYLKPPGVGDVAQETQDRFNVLHRFFFPGILIFLLLEWWWYFSRRRTNQEGEPHLGTHV